MAELEEAYKDVDKDDIEAAEAMLETTRANFGLKRGFLNNPPTVAEQEAATARSEVQQHEEAAAAAAAAAAGGGGGGGGEEKEEEESAAAAAELPIDTALKVLARHGGAPHEKKSIAEPSRPSSIECDENEVAGSSGDEAFAEAQEGKVLPSPVVAALPVVTTPPASEDAAAAMVAAAAGRTQRANRLGVAASQEELDWMRQQRDALKKQILMLHNDACIAADEVIELSMETLKLQEEADAKVRLTACLVAYLIACLTARLIARLPCWLSSCRCLIFGAGFVRLRYLTCVSTNNCWLITSIGRSGTTRRTTFFAEAKVRGAVGAQAGGTRSG